MANPLACVLSAAMMLDWLGSKHDDESATRAARAIEDASYAVLRDARTLTPDLGGAANTAQVTNALLSALKETS